MNTPLNRTLQLLLSELEFDAQGYRRLLSLLEAQFRAALAHDSTGMERMSKDIVAQVEEIEARRPLREGLMDRLVGQREPASLRTLARRLPQATPSVLRQGLGAVCQELERLVQDCKRFNLRNCELIHEQQALMQRLLGQPETGYAQP